MDRLGVAGNRYELVRQVVDSVQERFRVSTAWNGDVWVTAGSGRLNRVARRLGGEPPGRCTTGITCSPIPTTASPCGTICCKVCARRTPETFGCPRTTKRHSQCFRLTQAAIILSKHDLVD